MDETRGVRVAQDSARGFRYSVVGSRGLRCHGLLRKSGDSMKREQQGREKRR